ncbi:ABC transporter substrate-binding protein [Nonomuraea diastatica]|uniref:Extracellular solute-binding protein n=1 Tax=Nonomuraea diastatica TaxID=1848329 RepID=A0A4V6PD45_9ACTN|nr:extracellular solute-binding protein [Nonomuraea diastatica]TDD21507.1 extracellular solute-binding protein [Nonomuraea diastatica]
MMKPATVALGVLIASVLATSGCGTGSGGGEASSTLRVGCFGNDQRTQKVQAAAKAFESAHAGITVQLECTGFASYFDKLATQFAAQDAPDVVMLNDSFLGEYADRGALKELGASIDVSKFSEPAAAEGKTAKGRFGVAAGLNTMTILANPDVLKAAGVEMPDDSTWTWQTYAETAAKVTAGSEKGVYGSDLSNFGPMLELWLRQNGKSMYTNEGGLGYQTSDVTGFMEFLKGLGASKGIPPASVITEQHKALEQSGLATNKSAFGWFFSSAVGAVTKASGADLTVLRPPSTTGSSAEAALFFKPDSLWTINARAENPTMAQKFVDFMVNNPEAAKVTLTSLGVPANSQVREAIAAGVSPADKKALDFAEKITPDLGGQRPAIPAGGGKLDSTLQRHAMDVLFGSLTPQEAAGKLTTDMASAIKE